MFCLLCRGEAASGARLGLRFVMPGDACVSIGGDWVGGDGGEAASGVRLRFRLMLLGDVYVSIGTD